jgi:hypothetical protein
MSMKWRLVICGVMILMSGCTAASSSHGPPSPSPSAVPIEIAPSATPTVEIAPSSTPPPPLETSTGPYLDAGTLLDGVCFEYLLTLNGQVWTWHTPAELSAYYDQVEASELCPDPVARQDFDFSQGVLVGTVSTATGCDAAHRVTDVVRDDNAHTQTLLVELAVRPGCPYELVQPLLVAVNDVPDGYTLQIAVSGGDTP